MSAWIVFRDHLDLLITAALHWQLIGDDDADQVGRMLWKENLASVAYRYPEDRDGQRPAPDDFRDGDVDTYRHHTYPGRVDPQVVEAAARSLQYQSCEHPDWPASVAAQWVERLYQTASERITAYLAEHGPIDPRRQAKRINGWSTLIDLNGHRQVICGDGWSVPDRGVFQRAAALRTPPAHAHRRAS